MKRHIREDAEWLAAFDGVAGSICATCGRMFAASRSTKRYCSATCRLRAYRQRVPSIADIRKRLDRELDRAHRRIKSEQMARALRRQMLPELLGKGERE
jgi:hypothetical protein